MSRQPTQQELQRRLENRKARDARLAERQAAGSSARVGQRAGKEPKEEYTYQSIYYNKPLNLLAEKPAVEFFGQANLGLPTSTDATAAKAPHAFKPRRVRATKGLDVPITVASQLNPSKKYIKYTPEYNPELQATHTAPISGSSANLASEITTVFNHVKEAIGLNGRFTFLGEEPRLEYKGNANLTPTPAAGTPAATP